MLSGLACLAGGETLFDGGEKMFAFFPSRRTS
jgi:hypothetical protein